MLKSESSVGLGAPATIRRSAFQQSEHVGVPRPLDFCPQLEFRAQIFNHLISIPSTITVSTTWLDYN
jgi:hypothetical protein